MTEPVPSRRADPLRRHLERTMTFTYADGLALVQRRFRRGGWRGVDELLRDPPRTSEAVLHPEAPPEEIAPVELHLGELSGLGASCRRVTEERLGEHLLGATLSRWLSDGEARAAVDGWGGDVAVVYDDCPSPGRQVLVMATRWDDGARARRFARSLGRARRLRAAARWAARGSSRTSLRDRVVIHLEGVEGPRADQVTELVSQSLRF